MTQMRRALPRHLALVVDGNRHWARRQELPFFDAYKVAGSNLVEVVCHAADLGVPHVSAFLFSTENWKRDRDEVDAVMTAFEEVLFKHTHTFRQHGVRVRTIGYVEDLPRNIQIAIHYAMDETARCRRTNFLMAFNYGGRWDIIEAVRRFLKSGAPTEPQQLRERDVAMHLSTAPFGDPDLLIRTGGEKRLSNFMLWQLSYTELYFSDLMWPDFHPDHLELALGDYARRDRRMGNDPASGAAAEAARKDRSKS